MILKLHLPPKDAQDPLELPVKTPTYCSKAQDVG